MLSTAVTNGSHVLLTCFYDVCDDDNNTISSADSMPVSATHYFRDSRSRSRSSQGQRGKVSDIGVADSNGRIQGGDVLQDEFYEKQRELLMKQEEQLMLYKRRTEDLYLQRR